MIEVAAPGKLYIAGEYAVVEPGEPAVLVAVDRFLTVRLTESVDVGHVRSHGRGRAELAWVRSGSGIVHEHAAHDYVLSAIATIEQLRAELGISPRYFDLDIRSELDDASGRKFGLGSSAAVTAAVVSALDEFYGLGLSRTQRFKLALLASIEVSARGSGGDLAASVFGGWIRYTSPDREALRLHRSVHGVSATLSAAEWAGCGVTRIPPPDGLRLLVGWTGSPASTERLVEESRSIRAAAPSAGFLSESRAIVDAFAAACERGDSATPEEAMTAIRGARQLLQGFGTESGIEIETPQLGALCDTAVAQGAAAKPSGAGGGDCGIVLAPDALQLGGLIRAWETHDIRRLELAVHPPGGGIDEF